MIRQSRMSTRSGGNAPLTRGQLLTLVLVFIVTALALLLLDQRNLLGPVKSVVERPIFAVSQQLMNVGKGLTNFTDRFGNVTEIRAENDRLQAENDQLRSAAARVKELELENKQLTEQANFAVKFPEYKSVPARVIGRDPALVQKVLVLDRGGEDGIKMGMPVVSPNFLIGIVTEVQPHQCKVRLIIDQDMQIGVLLQEERAAGIMYGRWQQGGRLQVEHIGRDVTINPRAIVVTSNWTLHVPQGIPVGFVTKVIRDEQTDTQRLEVVPYVNFDSLETVSVVLTEEQTGQPPTR